MDRSVETARLNDNFTAIISDGNGFILVDELALVDYQQRYLFLG